MSSQPKEGWTRDIDFTGYSAPLSHSGMEISLLLMFLPHFYSITALEMDSNFQKHSWVSNRNIFASKDPTFPPQLPLGTAVFMFFPLWHHSELPGWTAVSSPTVGMVTIQMALMKPWQVREFPFISQDMKPKAICGQWSISERGLSLVCDTKDSIFKSSKTQIRLICSFLANYAFTEKFMLWFVSAVG